MKTKYWGWLAVKITALAAAFTSFVLVVYALGGMYRQLQMSVDATVFAAFLLLPTVFAVFWRICFQDQRHRCRVCGRRLVMPLASGRRSALLLNAPGTEYICRYGCGKLVEQLSLSRYREPVWTTFGDMWQELSRHKQPNSHDVV